MDKRGATPSSKARKIARVGDSIYYTFGPAILLPATLGDRLVQARPRLAVAEANLQSREETYNLTLSRYEAGLDNELSVQQACCNLEDTRSQIPTLRAGLEGAKNRLAVLQGRQPGSLHDLLAERRPIPVIPATVAVGMQAEVLRRRPAMCVKETCVPLEIRRNDYEEQKWNHCHHQHHFRQPGMGGLW